MQVSDSCRYLSYEHRLASHSILHSHRSRLATKEDTQANRAAFLLQSKEGERIGTPVNMVLPQFAICLNTETGVEERCVILQSEEADGITYFGGWLIDHENQIVGYASDFKLLGD